MKTKPELAVSVEYQVCLY